MLPWSSEHVTNGALNAAAHFRARRRLADSEQHAQMRIAAQEIEKLLREAPGSGMSRTHRLPVALEILLQHVDAGLGSAAIEQSTELGEAPAFGDDNAVQLDRLRGENDVHHPA